MARMYSSSWPFENWLDTILIERENCLSYLLSTSFFVEDVLALFLVLSLVVPGLILSCFA